MLDDICSIDARWLRRAVLFVAILPLSLAIMAVTLLIAAAATLVELVDRVRLAWSAP